MKSFFCLQAEKLHLSKTRIRVGFLLAILAIVSGTMLGYVKIGLFFGILFFTASFFNGWQRSRTQVYDPAVIILYFAVTSVVVFYLSQYILDQGIHYILPVKIVFNVFLCFILTVFFYLLFLSPIAAAALSGSLILFLSTFNYYITAFRGNEISLIDFLSIRTAVNVAHGYQVKITPLVLIAWFSFLLWLFSTVMAERFKDKKRIHIFFLVSSHCFPDDIIHCWSRSGIQDIYIFKRRITKKWNGL